MDFESVVLTSPHLEDYLECSTLHLKPKGKLYKKMIFRWGSFSHPKNPNVKVNVDQKFYEDLKRNFDDKVVQHVQFPMCGDKNEHVEGVDRNLGEIVDLASDDRGVYAYIDVRKNAEDIGSTILGASAKVHLNYLDRRKNKYVGPSLIHVASTNLPFLTDLDDYEEVAASDSTDDSEVILLTDDTISEDSSQTAQESEKKNNSEEESMTKEEMIAALSEDHGIDVRAGQDALLQMEGYVALSDVIDAEGPVTPETLSQTIVELTNSNNEREGRIQEQAEELRTIKLSAAEEKVDKLITEGRILSNWRDHMIEMELSEPDKFESMLVPEGLMESEFSEVGVTTNEDTHQDEASRHKERAARLASYVNDSAQK